MIDALIAGRLHGTAVAREARNGSEFATAKVRVTTVQGDAIFVNVIAFAEQAVNALLALGDGDSVALAGELTPKTFVDKNGVAKPVLDLVAHAVLSAYAVSRKRAAQDAESLPS